MTSRAIIKSVKADNQDASAEISFADRLRVAAQEKSMSQADLAKASGVPSARVNDYWKGPKVANAAYLFALAESLNVSAEWLALGRGPRHGRLVEISDADWIDVPEHDLSELTDEDKGPIVSTTPFRRDWLNRTLGQSNGIWLGRLPADLPRHDLREGDLVFLRDVRPGEEQDGAIYIGRLYGRLVTFRLDIAMDASMAGAESNIGDRRLGLRNIGPEDGKAMLVARVLGVPLKRL